jgi:hypothetical protein
MTPHTKLKNLILFEAESLELGYIGLCNPRYPRSMPWLTSLARNYTYFTSFKSQPYTTWSAAGLFVTECGLPLVISDVHWDVRQSEDFHAFSKVPCISTFLRHVGYKLYAFCAGSCDIMQMKAFLREHGFDARDSEEHHLDDDASLFQMLGDTFFPHLAEDKSSWPFAVLIINTDTHPWPDFRVGMNCDTRELDDDGYPWGFQSFSCLDQNIRDLVQRMEELGFRDSSEVLIFGDHLGMRHLENFEGVERNLTLFLPWRPQDELWRRAQGKSLTYYDFPETILKLAGIDFWPPFAFGADIFGEKTGVVPELADLKYIYGLVTGDIEGTTARCEKEEGFCQSDEF